MRSLALLIVSGCAHVPADSTAILKTQTQALEDAMSAGDRAVWDRYVDPQILYVSEAGDLETKASLLAQVVPLPPGISGKITATEFAVTLHGDTAIVRHADDEAEDYFGHAIHARYLTTSTWRYREGWKLIARQVLATLVDPPAITLPPAQLDEYAATFELTGDITYTIARDRDHLTGTRTGRPPQVLAIEARDVLFVPGQPRSRKILVRDATGRIDRLADRREGRDVIWRRR